jgi:Uma2 family endonuclease
MGLPAAKRRYTIEEYYELERTSSERHEFDDGEILAMSGGSPPHSLVAVNVAAELRNRLKGSPCRPYGSDLRVRLAPLSRCVYPDVTVICGPLQYDPDDRSRHAVVNPTLVVEVLSPSTEAYDRGAKFKDYRQVNSLQEYVLVSQHAPLIEVFFRQPDGTWRFTPVSGVESDAHLRSIQVDLPLAEVYAGVEFDRDPPSLFETAL